MPQPSGVYVLVHPERYISNDPTALGLATPGLDGDADTIDWNRLDEVHGQEIDRVSRAFPVRIVIDDGTIVEDLHADIDEDGTVHADAHVQLMPGLPADGWRIVHAEPHDLVAVARDLLPRTTAVTLAGFHRHDCVATTAATLKDAGCVVRLHENVVLPATPATRSWWTRSGHRPTPNASR